ncbi:Methyltransferase domain-containing protein [Andreprevotia lacus DSM 23236]|jgi:SAM-dependent methyltransferase|uniref:Methyltransferase domain-containing protein n=1 Tax=Andreprevotia lacus DSM 23236 TaxID=1121001 RepID=A0A1W1WXW0_9NEIS|nr:class I SAM-dependent methyltransferase [Andreprevotia lacus]SMC16420.1 Methyltransferase domain-containing protein [Andreprevotia lacus DSM 23236]
MEHVDFGKTATDYRRHRAGFPPALFELLAGWGIGLPGQRLLDLGTGTGTLARGFAQRGAQVAGLDTSANMLTQARQLDAEVGVAVDYLQGTAEATGLADGAFDIISAGQCWHWFRRDEAAHEAWRLLRPGGRIVLAHFDWLPLPGNVVATTESLILQHNPAWRGAGGTGIHPGHFADLAQAGFSGLRSASFDMAVPYSHEGWRGRIRASAGVAASLPAEQVAAFDAELAAMLARDFPTELLQVPHRVFAVMGVKC